MEERWVRKMQIEKNLMSGFEGGERGPGMKQASAEKCDG